MGKLTCSRKHEQQLLPHHHHPPPLGACSANPPPDSRLGWPTRRAGEPRAGRNATGVNWTGIRDPEEAYRISEHTVAGAGRESSGITRLLFCWRIRGIGMWVQADVDVGVETTDAQNACMIELSVLFHSITYIAGKQTTPHSVTPSTPPQRRITAPHSTSTPEPE